MLRTLAMGCVALGGAFFKVSHSDDSIVRRQRAHYRREEIRTMESDNFAHYLQRIIVSAYGNELACLFNDITLKKVYNQETSRINSHIPLVQKR